MLWILCAGWARDGTGGDYIDNLSPSFCFQLGLGLGLKLRFVNIGKELKVIDRRVHLRTTSLNKNAEIYLVKSSTNLIMGQLVGYKPKLPKGN